jgi:amino acid adenylation domain-containing protein
MKCFMSSHFPAQQPSKHQIKWVYDEAPAAGPLQPAQAGLRSLIQLTRPSAGQAVMRLVRIKGTLRTDCINAAFQELFKRHELLRVQIVEARDRVVHVRRTNRLPELAILDLSQVPAQLKENEYRRHLSEESDRILDPAHDPLVRAKLVVLDQQTHLLFLCAHRFVLDQDSASLLLQELLVHYESLLNATGLVPTSVSEVSNPPPTPSENPPLASAAAKEEDLRYWKAKLAGAPNVVELPSDRPRSLTRYGQVSSVGHRIPPQLRLALQALFQRWNVSLQTGILACFQICLSRHFGCTDFLLGTRNIRPAEEQALRLGCFAATIPLRADCSDDLSFAEQVRRTDRALSEAMDHQAVDFGELVEAILPDPPRGHAPMVQYLVGMGKLAAAVTNVGSLTLEPVQWPLENSGLDLSLWIDAAGEALLLSTDYRKDLFDERTVSRLLQRFEVLLGSLVASPDLAVSRHSMLTDAERHQLLWEWNHTQASYPSLSTYSSCFEEIVRAMPEAIAVSVGGKQVSFIDLHRAANRLAYFLQKAGVDSEVLVGVCLDRSEELAVALLATLKAGGAFIPLDPAYPRQRLQMMLGDAKPLLILSQRNLVEGLPAGSIPVICLDDAEVKEQLSGCPVDPSPVNRATAESLAYVIYTSGSTGKPNGVEVTQRAMVNHSFAVANVYQLNASDRVLQFASLSFDISVEEIFPSWLRGCAVVFRNELAVSSTQRFFDFLRAERVSIINIPTAYWHQLVNDLGTYAFPKGVTRVVIGGEQASPMKWRLWCAHIDSSVRFFNAYGPTEAAVTTTIMDCESVSALGSIPIGKPIANARVYVLDQHRQPTGVGVTGELYIAGDCLARGYRGNAALTAERFVPNPYEEAPGARMYRTGDFARWTVHGDLEFLGRADAQLKVRGYRVEPGEIEVCLSRHPDITFCAVVGEDRADGGNELIAYLVTRSGQSLTVKGLRQWLSEHLADYLIPSHFYAVPSLPVTPAGKVDRKALSRSMGEELSAGTLHADPTNRIEAELVKAWQSVLGKSRVGIDDHFFDLGGNSLLAAQVFASFETVCGKRLPLSILFEAPTIREIARRLEDRQWTPTWDCLVPLQTRGQGQPIFLVHGVMGNIVGFHNLAKELGVDRPVFGLQAQGLDGARPPLRSVEEMARLYLQSILALYPQGPYHLVGLSFGGLVAYEMAQQLKNMGRPVGLLAVLDAFPQGYDRHRNLLIKVANSFLTLAYKVEAHCTIHFRAGISGFPRILRTRSRTLRDWIRRKLDHSLPSRSGVTGEHRSPSMIVETANNLACDDYIVRPYSGDITIFIAAENLRPMKTLLRRAWRQVSMGGLAIHETPGNHRTLIDPPHHGALAEKLRSCLREYDEV